MANPTKISRLSVNPAIESRPFSDGRRAEMAAFAAAKEAEGFRVQITRRFNGRDMKTRKPIKVNVVHVFKRSA